MIGLVCVLSLAAAGNALLHDTPGKIKVCSTAYKHITVAHDLVQKDKYLLPIDLRRMLVSTAMKSEQLLIDHCPGQMLATPIAAQMPLAQPEAAPESAAQPLLADILQSFLD